MTDTNVFPFVQPGTFIDSLTEVLRNGARTLLAQAVETEVAGFLAEHAGKLTADGRQRVVRHGHLPERTIMTGIGPVAVRVPRVRDRLGDGEDRVRFASAILRPYARRSKSLEVLIPALYLKGISTGDFAEALAGLLGPEVGGLSASTVARLGDVGRGICPLAQARSVGQALCVLLGRRHLRAGAAGRRGAVSAGDHRRHAGRQEGAGRARRRAAREHAVLARAAD